MIRLMAWFWPQRIRPRFAGAMMLVSLTGFMIIAGGLVLYYSYYADTVSLRSMPAAEQERYQKYVAAGEQYAAEALAMEVKYWKDPPLSQVVSVVLGLTVLATAIAASLGVLVARHVGGPISDVAETARRLAAHDLSARASGVKIASAGAEVQQLVSDINALASTLERDDRRLREQAASIAHEFRTPLTVLAARLQAMLDGVISPDTSELKRLIAQVGGLTRIVQDLRTISIAEAQGLSLELRHCNLAHFLTEYQASMQLHARESGCEIGIVANMCAASLDHDRLRQILDNLVSNALRHSKDGGHITLTCETLAKDAVLCVQDDGTGIDGSVLARIFEPFSRSENSRSRDSGGSGLGLAVVKALVEVQGGRIRALNMPGGGALFEMRFPST